MKSIPEIKVDLDAPAHVRWIRPGKKIAGNDHTVHLALMRPATSTLKFKNYENRGLHR